MQIGTDEAVSFFHQQLSWETVPKNALIYADTKSSTLLIHATAAIGLALLSFARNSTKLKHQSFVEYGTALSQVHNSLSRPETAITDLTLAQIVLIGYFEVNIASLLLFIANAIDLHGIASQVNRFVDEACEWRSAYPQSTWSAAVGDTGRVPAIH